MRINEIDRRAFLKGIGAATLVCTGAGCSSGSKPEDNVQIYLLKIKRSWGGTSIIADIRITNINDFAIKDIKIQFNGYAPSGTVIDKTRRVIYQIFPSKSERIIPNFDIGLFKDQVTGVKAVVLNLELINPQRK